MRMKATNFLAILVLGVFAAFFVGCEADNPASIYDPDASSKATPQIDSVLPVDSTLAGVGRPIANEGRVTALAARPPAPHPQVEEPRPAASHAWPTSRILGALIDEMAIWEAR